MLKHDFNRLWQENKTDTCGFVVLVQLVRAVEAEGPCQAAGRPVVGQVAPQPQPQPLAKAQPLDTSCAWPGNYCGTMMAAIFASDRDCSAARRR